MVSKVEALKEPGKRKGIGLDLLRVLFVWDTWEVCQLSWLDKLLHDWPIAGFVKVLKR